MLGADPSSSTSSSWDEKVAVIKLSVGWESPSWEECALLLCKPRPHLQGRPLAFMEAFKTISRCNDGVASFCERAWGMHLTLASICDLAPCIWPSGS